MKFTFGSDPEFILVDRENRLRSAIGVVKGSKERKVRRGSMCFFYDNVLAECTVDPAETAEDAVESIRKSLREYSKIVAPNRLTTLAAGEFADEEMRHKDARKSGCETEFCAYKMKAVSPGKIRRLFKESNLRTAGGHVHIGTDLGANHETCVMLVRMLDLFLGVSALLLDGCEKSIVRRSIYGKPGRYRQPSYGVEYRTIGNFWLASPKLVALVFEICSEVVRMTRDGLHEEFWSVDRKKLDSDEFWNSGGNPATCHICHGYSVETLMGLFESSREEVQGKGRSILEIVFKHLPNHTKRRIEELSDKKFDMYEEWAL